MYMLRSSTTLYEASRHLHLINQTTNMCNAERPSMAFPIQTLPPQPAGDTISIFKSTSTTVCQESVERQMLKASTQRSYWL